MKAGVFLGVCVGEVNRGCLAWRKEERFGVEMYKSLKKKKPETIPGALLDREEGCHAAVCRIFLPRLRRKQKTPSAPKISSSENTARSNKRCYFQPPPPPPRGYSDTVVKGHPPQEGQAHTAVPWKAALLPLIRKIENPLGQK